MTDYYATHSVCLSPQLCVCASPRRRPPLVLLPHTPLHHHEPHGRTRQPGSQPQHVGRTALHHGGCWQHEWAGAAVSTALLPSWTWRLGRRAKQAVVDHVHGAFGGRGALRGGGLVFICLPLLGHLHILLLLRPKAACSACVRGSLVLLDNSKSANGIMPGVHICVRRARRGCSAATAPQPACKACGPGPVASQRAARSAAWPGTAPQTTCWQQATAAGAQPGMRGHQGVLRTAPLLQGRVLLLMGLAKGRGSVRSCKVARGVWRGAKGA
jgi:hypothetical protein